MEKSMEDGIGWLDRCEVQLKQNYKTQVSNFLDTLDPKDLIDMIGELEEYFELEDIGDLIRLAQTKLKGHTSLW